MSLPTRAQKIIARAVKFNHVYWSELFLFALALFFVFTSCVPVRPVMAGFGLDPSWRLALHYFYDRGFQFGTEIIFTYGPYGFISTWTYYPATYFIMLWTYTVMGFVYTIACWGILKKSMIKPWLVFPVILILSQLFAPMPQSSFPGDSFFFSGTVIFFMSYLSNIEKPYSPVNYLLAILLALSSIMKFSFCIFNMIVFCFVALDEIIYRRKAPVFTMIYAGAFLLFMAMAKQSLINLPVAFANEFAVIRAHGIAMTRDLRSVFAMGLYAAVSVVLWGLFSVSFWKHFNKRAIAPSVALAGMIFLIFRASFTRLDHDMLGMRLFSIMAICLVPAIWTMSRTRLWKLFMIVFMLAALHIGYTYGIKPSYKSSAAYINQVAKSAGEFTHYLFCEPRFLFYDKDLREQYEKAKKIIMNVNPTPKFDGTVDIYPYDCTGLITQNVRYRPRPIFQSYDVYNKALAEKNRDYLKSRNAPDFILLRSYTTLNGETIDGNFPTLGDSLSLPELSARYDLIGGIGRFAIMKKSPVPRNYHFDLIKTIGIEFGKPEAVPDSGQAPIWVEINIRESVSGRIFQFFGRSGRPEIKLKDKAGRFYSYHLTPSMARTGFLLSPILSDDKSYVLFWTKSQADMLLNREVSEFMLEISPEYKKLFEPEYTVTFYRLID